MPLPTLPRHRRRRPLFAAPLLLACTLAPSPLRAQGCPQCRDNLRATPPATQHAYRQAIGLLATAACAVCVAAVFALRSNTPR